MKLDSYSQQMQQTPSVKKYYIPYYRKSPEAEDRQVASIESQERVCLPFAEQKQLPILRTIKESHSAKAPGRPGFNELIEIIDKRKDIKGIICWKLNRLFRNPEDEGKIRQRLLDGRIEEIVTPYKTYTILDD